METALVPGIYDSAVADENLEIGTEPAHECARRLAREAGLLVGISSGGALAAALMVARRLREGMIVTVFADGGDKYLTDRFWQEC